MSCTGVAAALEAVQVHTETVSAEVARIRLLDLPVEAPACAVLKLPLVAMSLKVNPEAQLSPNLTAQDGCLTNSKNRLRHTKSTQKGPQTIILLLAK